MKKRTAVSKRIRFEIFKRDNFKCRYCGQSVSPGVILEIDHVIPVSKGGTNENINLVTSCWDCNRGKSKNMLNEGSLINIDVETQKNRIKEQRDQLKHYFKYLEQKDLLFHRLCEKAIMPIIQLSIDRWAPIDRHWKPTVVRFLKELGFDEVYEAASIAVNKRLEFKCSNVWKYFCGVCCTKIKNKQAGPNA